MEGFMGAYLDILKKDENGVIWIGIASTLEEAHSQIRADSSGANEYIIFNSQTGHRISVNLGGGSDS
jgi:hypothetical protein